jgi:pre-mRNA-splicing factor SPF27
MVEEETRRYRPTKNYLEHLPSVNTTTFETVIMTTEFERLQNRLPMEQLNMKRYELPPPPTNKLSELSAWQESVDNSMAQLEHQSIRAMNLELMLKYGCETWKAYLEVILAMQAKAQKTLQELKKDIQDVNWQRKSKQTKCGENLKSLEAKWVMLVSKNYEIEQAIANLEEKVFQKKQDIPEKHNQENGNHQVPDVETSDSNSNSDFNRNGSEVDENSNSNSNSNSNF